MSFGDIVAAIFCLGGLNPLCLVKCDADTPPVCTPPGKNNCYDYNNDEDIADDGDPHVAGDQFTFYCTEDYQDAVKKNYAPDSCQDEYILIEQTCEKVSAEPDVAKPVTKYFKCEAGCDNGKCNSGDAQEIAPLQQNN